MTTLLIINIIINIVIRVNNKIKNGLTYLTNQTEIKDGNLRFLAFYSLESSDNFSRLHSILREHQNILISLTNNIIFSNIKENSFSFYFFLIYLLKKKSVLEIVFLKYYISYIPFFFYIKNCIFCFIPFVDYKRILDIFL